MGKLKKVVSILLTACLVCANYPCITANAQQKTIDITDLSSWDGVTNYLPDSNTDAGGGGYELTKFYVASDSTYIYLRWDIQLSGQNVTDMVSTNLGSAFSCSSDGSTADAMAWLLFDNKGAVTASLERLTGTQQSVAIDSSEVKRFNTGSENALISVVTRVPFSAFTTIGFENYFGSGKTFPLWCQTNASSSLTANIKDRIPDSGYFGYNSATGDAVIVGAGLSSAKDFSSFSVTGQTGSTVIDSVNHTISVQMPAGTSLTSVQPAFTLSDKSKGAYVNSVLQASGTSSQDFTGTVTYTVAAEDASTQNWQVTITSALPDTAAPDANAISVVNNPTGTADAVTVTGLSAGDIISVYDAETAGSKLGTATVPEGSTQGVVTISQLGTGAGSVYVSVQKSGCSESARTNVSYNAETADLLSVHDMSYSSGDGEKYIDSSLTVSAIGNLSGAKVYIDQNFNSTKDSIIYNSSDVPSGLSASYDSAKGILTVSGTATADVYQTFLRTLKFSTTETSATKSINYLLSKSGNNVMYCSDTGHFYEYVPYSPSDDTSWATAKTSAEGRTYNGLTGYLATITSATENAFVTSKCGGAGWLGASDVDTLTGNPTGIWKWVTGPEAGTGFYNFYTKTILDSQYINWASGEPNGSGIGGSEHYLHILGAVGVPRPTWANNFSSFPAGSWNDYAGNSTYGSIFGYVVEYGNTYISLDSSSGLSGVSNITVAAPADSLSVHGASCIPDGSQQIIDSNLTIIANDNLTGAKVYIDQNFNSAKDRIIYDTVPSGLSVSYDTANGVLTVSGTATADVYQAFLRTLKFSTTDASGAKSINYILNKSGSNVMYCSDTGHFYEYVPGTKTWSEARTAAGLRTYNGLTGYLATITSASENAFVTSKCGGSGWLGASDLNSVTGDTTGIWKWVTGPEASTQFYNFNTHSIIDAKYNNWASGEPNNYNNTGEYYLHIYTTGTWNDYKVNDTAIAGYIVEYGDAYVSLGSNSGLSGVATITVEAQPSIDVTGNPTDWVSDANLAVNTTVGTSGLKSVTVNGNDITGTYTGGYTVSQNGTYTFTVTSNSGLTATQTVEVTKIDNSAPNNAVITDADKYTAQNWYPVNQTVTATFTPTAGSTEKLQYSLDGGKTWTDGASVEVTAEGVNTVAFRVADELGNTSAVQTATVQIDKTAPANVKITAEENAFTSLLNDITFGLFFKDTVDVSITAEDSKSGIKTIEYQKVEDKSAYDVNGTWTTGASFGVTPNDKFIVYARITDKAGNCTIINTNGIITDSTEPSLSLSYTSGWQASDISVGVTVGDNLAGVKEVTYTTNETEPQSGTVVITNGTGTIPLTKEGEYELTVTAKDNSGNTVIQMATIKLDKTQPNIAVITDADKYTAKKWYPANQTVAATFTPTAGSKEKLQYSLDGGKTWTDGASVEVTTEGVNTVAFRVIDELGNTSAIQTATVQIDKTAPKAPTLEAIDSSTTKITGTAEAGTVVTVKNASGSVLGTAIAGADGTYSLTITAQTADTILYVAAEDTAGNKSTVAAVTVETLISHVAEMIDALPNPDTATDGEILGAQENIIDTKQKYDILDETGRSLISTDRKDKLDNLIYRLNVLLEIVSKDKSTGIAAEGIGTAVVIPELNDSGTGKVRIALSVNPFITEAAATLPSNIALASTTLHTGGRQIIEAYDISLIKSIYETSGGLVSTAKVSNSNIVDYITIRIPVPNGYTGRTDLVVVYIDDNGNVTPLTTKVVTIDGVEYVEFQTNHFSDYAIVASAAATTSSQTESNVLTQYTNSATSPQTGDSAPIALLFIVFVFSGATLIVLTVRGKNHKRNNL